MGRPAGIPHIIRREFYLTDLVMSGLMLRDWRRVCPSLGPECSWYDIIIAHPNCTTILISFFNIVSQYL